MNSKKTGLRFSRMAILGALGLAAFGALAGTVATTEDQEATGFADSRKIVRDPALGRTYIAYRAKFKQDNATNYRIFVKYSDDEGGSWHACNGGAPIDTEGSFKQRVPSIAISPDVGGTLHVVWYGLHSGKQENQREIKYSRSTNHCANWSATLRVTDDSGFEANTYSYWQEHPVVFTYGNFVFIAWEGRNGTTPNGGIRFVRSSDKGGTFGGKLFIQRDAHYAFSRPTLVAMGSSTAPTLWIAAHAYDTRVSGSVPTIWWTKSTDAGATWSQGWAKVCAACKTDQRHVSMSPDSSGHVHLAWRAADSRNYSQIYYASSTSSGFTTPIAVSPTSMFQFSPQIEVDRARADKIHVIWSETSNDSGFPSEKPGDGYIYNASKDASAKAFSGRARLTSDGFSTYPTLRRTTKSLEGNLDAVWTEYTSGSLSTTFMARQQGLAR